MTALWLSVAAIVLTVPTRRRRRVHSSRAARQWLRGVGTVGVGSLVFGVASGALGLALGLAVAGAAAVVGWRLLPRILKLPRRLDGFELGRLPLVLDLVASILRTGAPVSVAVTLGAEAAGPRLRGELRQIGALLRLGATAADAWSSLAAEPTVRPVAIVAVRSADSGIRLADGWSALAGELRAEAATAATARASRAGTWVMAPLGLCFLPSFVCLGIAPVVVGIASGLLNHSGL